MQQGISSWHFHCTSCGYEASDLQPTINEQSSHKHIDEKNRETGLKSIRVENFRAILSMLDDGEPSTGKTLLDVGAAHGWFLEQAASGYKTLGVEPDEYVAAQTSNRGIPVRVGYFPSVLKVGETFDVIIFNDVIEHIPDIDAALDACHTHLNPSGRLVLNLPCSRGLFYRLSTMLSKLGWKAPFDRLWQKGFPSPHVHYFNQQNLERTVAKHGFTVLSQGELPSIRGNGLSARIKLASDISAIGFVVQYFGTLAILPWTKIFPSDIMVSIFRKV
jgi:SAM-dependent methyltransferase